MKYYKNTRYKDYAAADDAGNCYTYEDREWLQTGWIKATWEETISYLKRFISNSHYSQLISESDLKKAGIPPITKKTVRDQPAYEYYFGEHNHYVAKGDGDNRFLYEDGWWEYVHGLIYGMCQTATDEVLRGQLLYEKDLAGHKVPPVRPDNQICRLPDPEMVKLPLKQAVNLIENGSFLIFFLQVGRVDNIIYIKFPEFSADYKKAKQILDDFISQYEDANSRAIEYVKQEHKGEDFSDYMKVSEWIKEYVQTHEKQYDIDGLTMADVAKHDKTGKLQQAVDTIKRIHMAIVEKNKYRHFSFSASNSPL